MSPIGAPFRTILAGGVELPDAPLAHHWRVDEGSGTTLNDDVGSLNASINDSSIRWMENGLGGHNLSFDDNTGVVEASDSSLNGPDYAFMGWARPNPDGNNRVYGGTDGNSNGWLVRHHPSGNLMWQLYVDNADGGSVPLTIDSSEQSMGEWTFLAFVLDSSSNSATFYWGFPDDSSVSSVSSTNYTAYSETQNIDTVWMGSHNTNPSWTGGADDWHVGPGDTSLTTSEINEWFNATKSAYQIPGVYRNCKSQVASIAITDTHGFAGSGRILNVESDVYKFDISNMDDAGDGTFSMSGTTPAPQCVRIYDGAGYVTRSEDGSVYRFDPSTMNATSSAPSAEIHNSGVGVFGLAFDSTYGYSTGDDQLVRKWDPDTLSTESETFGDHTDPRIYGLAVDDTYGYSGGRDFMVRKWDTATMTQQATYSHPHDILSLHIDSSYVYSTGHDSSGVGGSDTEVRKLNKSDLSEAASLTRSGDRSGYGLAVSDNFVFVGTDANKVLKLDKSDLSYLDEFDQFYDRAYTVVVDDNEDYLYASGWDSNVYKIDVATMDLP